LIWAAAAVHIFTALGAVAALLAARAIFEGDLTSMFAWLAVALIMDAIDGTFARAVNVKEHLSRFSGETLDLVVDFLTYVFVPVLALLHFGKLEGTPGLILAAATLLSSLFHFADTQSKDAAYRFVGFPALWNVVALYVFAFDMSASATAWLSTICVVTAFIPLPFVHPLRVAALRPLTLAVLAAGSAASASVLVHGFPAGDIEKIVLAAAAAYGLGLTMYWFLAR